MTRDARVAAAIGAGCVVVAVVLALVVDGRLDRQWVVRTAMLALTLVCVAVLAIPANRARRSTRLIGISGILVWGIAAPLTLTSSAASPEAKFAMRVHDDAAAAAAARAESVITVADMTAATTARGGAVGRLVDGKVVDGDRTFPLVLRPTKDEARPRVCLTIEHGTDARIRRC